MRYGAQAGATLIETLVAAAIAALALLAAIGAGISATRTAVPDPRRAALAALARREMAVARDLLTYDGAALAPATSATTLPLGDGTRLPVRLELRVAPLAGASDVTVLAVAGALEASERATLAPRAPFPGSTVLRDGLVPAPTGAP